MSTDITHTFTDYADDDTYGQIKKVDATAGGMRVETFRSNAGAAYQSFRLLALLGENALTTKSTGGFGIIQLGAGINSGSTGTNLNSDGNLLSVDDYGTVRAIIDAEGELHTDYEIGPGDDWDDWDDLALASDLSRLPKAKWDQMMRYQAEDFERAGLLTLSIDHDGRQHAFIKHRAMLQFSMCCFREVYDRMQRYEKALLSMGADPAMLGSG
jgi:hypothetical protein